MSARLRAAGGGKPTPVKTLVAYLLVDCRVQPSELAGVTVRMFYDCYQHARDKKSGELVTAPALAVEDERAEFVRAQRRRGVPAWEAAKRWGEHVKTREGRRRG